MADNTKFVQTKPEYTLSGSGISASATSATINNLVFPNSGDNIVMADFGDIGYVTFEPGTEKEENASFTGITVNGNGTSTLTGLTKGLDFAAPYTSVAALKKGHGGNTPVVFSNPAPFYDQFAVKDNDESITGLYTFDTSNRPLLTTDADTTDDKELVTKGELNRAALGTTTVNRVVVAGTAGETVAAGDLVYLDITDTEWKKVDATDTATLYNVEQGIAQGAGTDGNSITGGVLTSGIDSNQSGLSANNNAFATDTAGTIGNSAGTNEKIVGVVLSATEVLFDPDFGPAPTADEKDALAGASGAPDTNNRYETRNDTSNAATQTGTTIAFVDSNPDTITDSGNGFVTSGFKAGQDITVSGSASNDGTFTIATVAAGTITLIGSDTLVAEGAGATVTISADRADKLVRANGSGLIDSSFIPSVADEQIFTTSGTWTKPSDVTFVKAVCIGAGGGGGGGIEEPNNECSGGGGGGGGAVTIGIFSASDLGATETITVGAGGAGGNGVTTTSGNNGANGGFSSFGNWLRAGGGGGGEAGQETADSYGGGGGGSYGSASGITGGTPTASTDGIAGQGATGADDTARNSEWGGASGGGGDRTTASSDGSPGGSSIFGAPGGGAGGASSPSGTKRAGMAGGATQSYTAGGGASGGAIDGGDGNDGDDNATFGKGYTGTGGGGGGGNNSGDGGDGGDGGAPGGGGGGAGSCVGGTGGDGGDGGRGEVRVYSW